jgi:hypothetical protein
MFSHASFRYAIKVYLVNVYPSKVTDPMHYLNHTIEPLFPSVIPRYDFQSRTVIAPKSRFMDKRTNGC